MMLPASAGNDEYELGNTSMHRGTSLATILPVLSAAVPVFGEQRENLIHETDLIFAREHLHNHGSCIVECPNGTRR